MHFSSPQARDHARQLLEKHVKKPFFESARYADGKERMTPDEVSSGLTWLSERFVLIRYEDEELPSIDWVLDTARAAVMRCVRICFWGACLGTRYTFPHTRFVRRIRHAAMQGVRAMCGA